MTDGSLDVIPKLTERLIKVVGNEDRIVSEPVRSADFMGDRSGAFGLYGMYHLAPIV